MRCGHEKAFRLYRRESRKEVDAEGRSSRGFKGLEDGGAPLWYCPKDKDGCGRLVIPAPPE